jgi:hypothetical protein
MPVDTDIQAEVRNAVKEMFADPNVAARVCAVANIDRPAGTGRKSRYPYYKEVHAVKLKRLIDDQIKTKQDIFFRYEDALAEGKSENSVYLMVNQAIRYLLDFLDPEGTYNNWYKMVEIHRDKKKRRGVSIELIAEAKGERGAFVGEMVVPRETTTPKWRIAMEEWLESKDTKPFIQEGLALSLEEVRKLREQLDTLHNIMADVTVKKVSIVKTR